jgi:hypothetical protein
VGVYVAAERRIKMQARLPGGLINREVRRGGESRRDTAQPETALAVRPEALDSGYVVAHTTR